MLCSELVERVLTWIDRALVENREILVATDFDGTLADIRQRPSDVFLDARASSVLRALTAARGVHLAVMSGRTKDDLAPRVRGLGPLWLATDHGEVVTDPQQRAERVDRHVARERVEGLRARADELARVFRGAHVEVKPTSVALHYRDVPAHKQPAVSEMFRLACLAQRARPLAGRMVLEGRFGESDKGTALAHIMSRLPRGTAVIYVGDDVTDEPALRYAFDAPLGLALFVRSSERGQPAVQVHGWLESPSEWVEILEALAGLRGRSAGAA